MLASLVNAALLGLGIDDDMQAINCYGAHGTIQIQIQSIEEHTNTIQYNTIEEHTIQYKTQLRPWTSNNRVEASRQKKERKSVNPKSSQV